MYLQEVISPNNEPANSSTQGAGIFTTTQTQKTIINPKESINRTSGDKNGIGMVGLSMPRMSFGLNNQQETKRIGDASTLHSAEHKIFDKDMRMTLESPNKTKRSFVNLTSKENEHARSMSETKLGKKGESRNHVRSNQLSSQQEEPPQPDDQPREPEGGKGGNMSVHTRVNQNLIKEDTMYSKMHVQFKQKGELKDEAFFQANVPLKSTYAQNSREEMEGQAITSHTPGQSHLHQDAKTNQPDTVKISEQNLRSISNINEEDLKVSDNLKDLPPSNRNNSISVYP